MSRTANGERRSAIDEQTATGNRRPLTVGSAGLSQPGEPCAAFAAMASPPEVLRMRLSSEWRAVLLLWSVDRRHFLRTVATAAPLLALPGASLAAVTPRVLTFAHLHTDERLTVEYSDGLRYLPDALGAINHLLRDFRTGEVHAIDPTLLDLLHRLHGAAGSTRPFEVISGYRSPQTNTRLQRTGGGGVASSSLHMRGQAIDIRLPDVPLASLRDAALSLARGGVGYYPTSGFVHVDTGRVRRW